MTSKISFLNSLKERNKTKENTDELAIVKAAAWAWYQHGSGSEGNVIKSTEFHSSKTRHPPRPSRYKLEAVRLMANKEVKKGSMSRPPKEKSLLDAYEVQSITRKLNSLIIESSHNKHVNSASNNSSVDIGGRKMEKKKVKKEKMRKGSWLRHGVVCGREEDVVDPIALRDGHHRQSVNLVKLPTARGTNL
ncbi:uncharacterized protein LOC130727754 [Lotus japonicus]|uniref:uncharacterized protein LOC130727754 n=1 Tax=Lotus japonicus TaxID=34305 RepID=UPI00258CDCA1|nr:uncharacterized protein LOC130727754 [Lotus japonicus]